MNILIAGCGDIGIRLAKLLAAENCNIWGMRRHCESFPDFIQPLKLDMANTAIFPDFPCSFDYVFYLAAADNHSEKSYQAAYVTGLKNLLNSLQQQQQQPRHTFFSSSTSVYGQEHGELVNENSETKPAGFSGKVLLEAEQLLHDSAFKHTIVRFAGIYGAGRTRLLNRLQQGQLFISESSLYTNRIHQDDCARVLQHLMHIDNPESLYLAVDNQPVLQNEVYTWLAEQLQVNLPEIKSSNSTPAHNLRAHKRCCNKRLCDTEFTFLYPDYKSGYTEMLKK